MILKRLVSRYTNSFISAGWTSKSSKDDSKSGDAYLITPKILAICDGLSIWRSRGIDPGTYSWQLVRNIEKSYHFLPEDSKYNPKAVLTYAVKETTEAGSSTCILSIIHPEQPRILCGCIGDSGLIILRKVNNEVIKIAHTHEVVEKFDQPLTFGFEGKSPEDAFYTEYEVQDKDVVLLYSDGVSHNMYIDHVIRMVRPFMMLTDIPDLEIVAEMITEKAQSLYEDPESYKPYGETLNKPKLGKLNEATVVIGQVNLKSIE